MSTIMRDQDLFLIELLPVIIAVFLLAAVPPTSPFRQPRKTEESSAW